MTPEEFSNGFDALINAQSRTYLQGIDSSPIDYSVDEYEKSLYLTQAQQEFVRQYYSGGKSVEGFDASEATKRTLDALVHTYTSIPAFDYDGDKHPSRNFKYAFIKQPENLWYILYEQAVYGDTGDNCLTGKTALVVPTTYDTLWKQANNPFRGPKKDRVLRLDLNNGYLEIVSKYDIESYYMRYLIKPRPIITTDLPDGLSIEGESKTHGCDLNQQTHDTILKLAVASAVSSKRLSKIQRDTTTTNS